MVNNTKIAPFTDEEVRILKLWQENNYHHPYTCCHEDMEVTNEGLKCKICGRLQLWVHDFSILESAATYNPFEPDKYLKLKEKENESETE